MSKKDELISKLIPSLKYQIKEIKESYDAMDEVSWNDQQGVIITGSEAELFVKLIESTQQISQPSEVMPSDSILKNQLIEKYQSFTKFVLRYTKDIIESQRCRELLNEIDDIEAQIRMQESKLKQLNK